MRNRKTQRALKKAGIRREEKLGPRNGEQYIDPTPEKAVLKIITGGACTICGKPLGRGRQFLCAGCQKLNEEAEKS